MRQNGAKDPQYWLAGWEDVKAEREAGNVIVDQLLIDAPLNISV